MFVYGRLRLLYIRLRSKADDSCDITKKEGIESCRPFFFTSALYDGIVRKQTGRSDRVVIVSRVEEELLRELALEPTVMSAFFEHCAGQSKFAYDGCQ